MLGAGPWRPGTGNSTVRCADLQLDARASRALLRLRDRLHYRLTLTNHGDSAATGVRLVLKLSGQIRVVSTQQNRGTCTLSGPTLECGIDQLGIGQTAVIDVRFRPRRAGALTASVEVAAREVDRNPDDNRARLAAQAFGCSVLGTRSRDVLRGTRRRDVACSLEGNDVLSTLAEADLVLAGLGDDRIGAGRGRDVVFGERGRDTINPGPGRDRVSGGPDDDRILVLDRARDVVDCGPGSDFVLADRRDRVAFNCESVRRAR